MIHTDRFNDSKMVYALRAMSETGGLNEIVY